MQIGLRIHLGVIGLVRQVIVSHRIASHRTEVREELFFFGTFMAENGGEGRFYARGSIDSRGLDESLW